MTCGASRRCTSFRHPRGQRVGYSSALAPTAANLRVGCRPIFPLRGWGLAGFIAAAGPRGVSLCMCRFSRPVRFAKTPSVRTPDAPRGAVLTLSGRPGRARPFLRLGATLGFGNRLTRLLKASQPVSPPAAVWRPATGERRLLCRRTTFGH